MTENRAVVRGEVHEARRAGAVLVAALHREGLARRRLAIRKNRAVDAAGAPPSTNSRQTPS